MKNQLFVLSLALGLTGCFGGGSTEPAAQATPAPEVAAAPATADPAACPYKTGDMTETECREMAKDCPMPKATDTASAGGSATGAASGGATGAGNAPMACCAKEGN